MATVPFGPSYGERLIPHVVDEKAGRIPNQTYMRYPLADWEQHGYQTMTWKQYADTINKTAYWLDQQLGQSISNDTIAYMGPHDPRHAFLQLAAIKTNRKLLSPDGRITKQGYQSLLPETGCKAWLYAKGDEKRVQELEIQSTGVKLLQVPALEWFLEARGTKHYPYNKTYEEAKHDLIGIIHTSGSTGLPKPIYYGHWWYNTIDAMNKLSKKYWPKGISWDVFKNTVSFGTSPPQWVAGVVDMIVAPAFLNTVSVILPAVDISQITNKQLVKIMRENHVDGLTSAPYLIQQLYHDPETQSFLKSLEYIVYLGAALEKSVGDDLTQHVRLSHIIGSTETGPQVSFLPSDRMNWMTHDYVPDLNTRFERVPDSGTASDGSDDLYELVLYRPDDGKPTIYQAAWWNQKSKDQNSFETNELYAPKKDSDGRTRWTFTARKDDFTKLNWMAKFHAQDIENKVKRHPAIRAVMVGGDGRPLPFVVVDRKQGVMDDKSDEEVLDDIYEVIIEINVDDVQEVRIPKELVILTTKDKPFKFNNKMVVLRREVEKDYAEEIKEAYQKFEALKMT